jgi:mannose-6-phosphate isomerase-like protein (cupin superfamily)
VIRGALLLLLAAACSSAPSHPLSEEERLYRSKCTSCHRAYEPGERKDWPQVIDKMQAERKTRLTEEQRAEILVFLQGTGTSK